MVDRPRSTALCAPWLREQFLPRIRYNPQAKRRLYVSRRLVSVRRVVNELEVAGLLAGWGFEPVTLELLPVAEQIRLFAEADWVVGAHGAGFANLVFSSPGGRVVEFAPGPAPNPYFEHYFPQLSSVAGKERHILLSQATEAGDVVVNLDDLAAALAFQGLSTPSA